MLTKSDLDMKVRSIDYAFPDTFDWFLFNITVRKICLVSGITMVYFFRLNLCLIICQKHNVFIFPYQEKYALPTESLHAYCRTTMPFKIDKGR